MSTSPTFPSFRARLSRLVLRARLEPDLALGVVLLAFVLLVVLFPSLFTSHSPLAVNVDRAMEAPSSAHPFGTDDVGRDVLARVVHGTRMTLSICASALAAAALIGGALGMISGFLGGRIDMVLGRLVDVILSFPPIIFGVMVTGILGPKTINLVFALTVVYVPLFFRIARSGAMAEAGMTYVEAARSLGLSPRLILMRHVARNVLPVILVQCMVLFPLMLQIQSALGFLGLGVQPPTPDWGAILQQGKDYILLAPWMSAFPGLAILITALALMLVGRALQRRMDRR
ncbi:ABC transporter permease [Bosea sp. NBC_00550]|uniref:ABC transporter permease n=1 Tax=Bosea sp. NBC_00550 TaxID=2969621 RepID=UPI00222E1332|nr:ABC transporter permease [Bosea sp. NBC_00550]UZF93446.1 ABC transporter permease [Bosea sp. NBC_00550]